MKSPYREFISLSKNCGMPFGSNTTPEVCKDHPIEELILSTEKIHEDIIEMHEKNQGLMPVLECVVEYCEEKDIEIEKIKEVLSVPILSLMEEECENLHLIKKVPKIKMV